MRPVSIAGVIGGGIVDVVLSGVLGAVILFTVLHPQFNSPMTQAQLRELTASAHTTLWVGWTAGCFCSMIGGFVSAQIARRHPLLNGALSAWLCIAVDIVSIAGTKLNLHIWLDLLGLMLSPLLGLAGGYLRQISRPGVRA